MQSPTLKIDWATHEAARYACERWHYSKCLPVGKLVKVGVWENEKFIGVVVFSRGASPNLLSKYDLSQTAGCELTRIALKSHDTPVSRIISISLKFLKKQSPGMRLVVSFADPEQGHHGGVYQATNWIYTGTSGETIEYFVRGKWQHVRNSYETIRTNKQKQFKTRVRRGKFRYLYPFDEELRNKLRVLSLPYPKRGRSISADASDLRSEEAGSTPSRSLQRGIDAN